MNIEEKLQDLIAGALMGMGVPKEMMTIALEHPDDPKFGDYSTNVAMHLMKSLGATAKNPVTIAEKITEKIEEQLKDSKTASIYIEKVEVVRPGFINFYLNKRFFVDSIEAILEKNIWYGKNTKMWNKKIIIEHTNLNPFKPFHIGHLVNNAVGESLSRVLEFQDVKLSRASYGGDVGMHVAKALWGMMNGENTFPAETATLSEKVAYLGAAYKIGSDAFEADGKNMEDIKDINKKVYEKSDLHIQELYEWGRVTSLKYFQELYKKLGTRFDYNFYESEVADDGIAIVKAALAKGVFKESDGAVIFPGEDHGLHNRVFLTSQGLPTYEAKELGLTKKKFELHDFDESIIVTASEQNDYFKVIHAALGFIYPEIAARTKHIGHGYLRTAEGKMSSRKGNVITGESLITDVEEMVKAKMVDRDFNPAEKKDIVEKVAIGAIKYSILRQSVGKDIIFDFETSLSFEGDSGPYLQYSFVRARSVLKKAEAEGIKAKKLLVKLMDEHSEILPLERLLYQFPEIVERAALDMAPNYIATYIITVASEFNAYYAKNKIVDQKDPESPYKVALTEAVSHVIKNGLYLLGIDAPEKM